MHGELLSFSAPLIVSAAMAFVLFDLDTFMLGYFASTVHSTQRYRQTGIHLFSVGLVRPGVVAAILVAIVHWVVRTFFPITVPILITMFAVFMVLCGLVILRFGGIEDEEVMLVLSFEDRFRVDLGPLKDGATFLMR